MPGAAASLPLDDVSSWLRPQDPLLRSSYAETLARCMRQRLRYTAEGIPTLGGKSLVWSSDLYQGVKRQFHIQGPDASSSRTYHSKLPSADEAALMRSYSGTFRRMVRKARREHLVFEEREGAAHSHAERRALYEIFQATMARLGSFTIPWRFFDGLLSLAGAPVTVFTLRPQRGAAIGFQLAVGDVLYLNGSTDVARSLGANHLLLHHIFVRNIQRVTYLGTAVRNTGLERFKASSGCLSVGCDPRPYGLDYKLSARVFRARLLQRINLRPIFRVVMAYPRGLSLAIPYG